MQIVGGLIGKFGVWSLEFKGEDGSGDAGIFHGWNVLKLFQESKMPRVDSL